MTGFAPLEGVSVLALEQAVSMPYTTFLLGELGATIVKVERPDKGDLIREWDDVVNGLSTGFVWVNANKRSLTVDLKTPEGRDIIQTLAKDADVFVENFSPGTCRRLGLDAETLMEKNPHLIYCSLSGYGQDGPYRDRKAYDLLVQGESGLLMTNGYPEAPAKVGVPITDLIAGSTAAIGVISALHERDHTGRGVYLDTAMLDATALWLGYFPHYFWHKGIEPPRTGMRHQYLCPYGPFLAADGEYVNLVVASQDDWSRFCIDVIDRPEWLDDPAFHSMEVRTHNRERLDAEVEREIERLPSDEWFTRLADARLPHGKILNISAMVQHPQLAHRKIFVDAKSPTGRVPVTRFALAPVDKDRRIPALGQDTDEILTRLGYKRERITELRDRGIV